jgi:GDP-4-dehydro-6-deoxy-D-mannose reductase
MRILVTGATGFVGRWLVLELEANGHEAIGAPASAELDITDEAAVDRLVSDVRPDAIAHLAGVSYALDAARDPEHAFAVNEGGTRAVMAASAAHGRPRVLVSGSSEVYGDPIDADLPLREDAATRTNKVYGLSKLAQERAALELGLVERLDVAVTRSFNHTGPGQRPDFVAPALATRVIQAKREGRHDIAVGNLDVRRDLGDVRDVVHAYRLLLEGLGAGTVPTGTVVNVATGRATEIRRIVEILGEITGIAIKPRVDEMLVRTDDPPVIVGDAGRLNDLTGWQPNIPLRQTLADLVSSLELGDGQ